MAVGAPEGGGGVLEGGVIPPRELCGVGLISGLVDRWGDMDPERRRPGERGGLTPGCNAAPEGVMPSGLIPPNDRGVSSPLAVAPTTTFSSSSPLW